MPLYDKDLYIRMQVFDWLYSSEDLLTDRDPSCIDEQGHFNGLRLPILAWENRIKQAEKFIE